jgi:hypothetical protein
MNVCGLRPESSLWFEAPILTRDYFGRDSAERHRQKRENGVGCACGARSVEGVRIASPSRIKQNASPVATCSRAFWTRTSLDLPKPHEAECLISGGKAVCFSDADQPRLAME